MYINLIQTQPLEKILNWYIIRNFFYPNIKISQNKGPFTPGFPHSVPSLNIFLSHSERPWVSSFIITHDIVYKNIKILNDVFYKSWCLMFTIIQPSNTLGTQNTKYKKKIKIKIGWKLPNSVRAAIELTWAKQPTLTPDPSRKSGYVHY